MSNKLCISVCSFFKREVVTIIKNEKYDDVIISAFPSKCGRPPTTWHDIKRGFHNCDNCNLHVFGSCCLAALDDPPAGLHDIQVHHLSKCFYLFASPGVIDSYLRKGAYLITPNWVAKWRSQLKILGFDQRELAQEFFNESITYLLLIDTGVDSKSQQYLQEFADFVGLSFEVVPVGLDYLRLRISNIVMDWRLKSELSQSKQKSSNMNRRLADYAMGFDVISDLANITSEESVIEKILELFTMLFIPSHITYTPIINGKKGSVQSNSFSSEDNQALVNQLTSMPGDYGKTPSDTGFWLWIRHIDERVGFLVVDGIAFSEHKEHYLNLAISIVGVCGLAVTNARRFEQLRHTKNKAEVANQAKSTFLSNMSHEFRTPLNAILGFTELMTDAPPQKFHDYLSIIYRSGEHLLGLINDVLDMAKIESGQMSLNPTSFDLYYVLGIIEDMLQLKAKAKGLRFLIDNHANLPRYIETDEKKLRQVLINLLGNAIKFTQEGGISLRARMDGTCKRTVVHVQETVRILFEIEDTGPGIAPDEIDTVFEAFAQTETGKQSKEGTGLGLPISRRFVQLMGGDITVTSIVGQGTIFRFDIQVDLAESADVVTKKPSRTVIGLEPGQSTYRILVVDDKSDNRQLLIQLLTPLGFEVQESENGQEGIAMWESWSPHLILMDMRMPVMNGYQATQYIKETLKGQATIIIAVTASTFEDERTVVLNSGCDDFIRKPFRKETMLEKIAEHLGICYIYQESGETTKIQDKVESSVILLDVMPHEWIAELHQAATELDDDIIFELIENIPQEYASLIDTLTNWTDVFRFDKIIELLEDQNLL